MERELHCWLQSISTSFGASSSANPRDFPNGLNWELDLGIGDDAAVINLLQRYPKNAVLADSARRTILGSLVLTTDTIAEGTHFDLRKNPLELVGRKSLAINLSDIAAMGATPIAALLTLVIPTRMSLSDVKRLVTGCLELAREYRIDLIGGDTNVWSGDLIVGMTVVGTLPPPIDSQRSQAWRISGAEVGDQIFVSGRFGGSILGHHLTFQPRIELARYLQANYPIKAATDISDSLSLDLHLMAQACPHVKGIQEPYLIGVEIDSASIPIAPSAQQLSEKSGESALHHALTDGEDFELAIAVDPKVAELLMADMELKKMLQSADEDRGIFTRIGQFINQPGFFLLQPQQRMEFPVQGYSH